MGISVRGFAPRGAMGAAFAAVLVGGGAVACGEGSGSDSGIEDSAELTPTAAMEKVAENSEDITSLRYRVTGTTSERGRLVAEASMKTEPTAMTMKFTLPDKAADAGVMEIRFVDKAIYVGGSAVDSEKLGGKSWLRAGAAVWGRGAADNNTYNVLPSQLEVSPVVQSRILTGSKDVRRIGAETVDGTKTLHYRGTVTSRGLRAVQSAAEGDDTWDARTETVDQFVALGVDGALTVDLWVDGDDHAERFRMRGRTYPTRAATDGGSLDLTVTFLDVNGPVTVETPPAGDTSVPSPDAQEG
ncbi:hypothetical protein ACFWP5_16285 [Streptomyces sp. NPDC058469]|uniref:hypothetical protein n=1 Tax=Streptomyces sp. NPDC058469 TaxID=3346514 RepID=UPI00365D4F20